MNNLVCLQVSIDSPGPSLSECVSSQNVPMPEAPSKGALIKVVCAGACYRTRRSSSVSSSSSSTGLDNVPSQSPAHKGVRDAALFPGYEVAGIIEALGEDVNQNDNFKLGDRVVIYPYEGVPAAYSEYTSVPDVKYLVRLPDSVSLNVAAMLPSGALLAMSTVHKAHEHVQRILAERPPDAVCKILIIGTGGLSLWGLRIASYHYSKMRNRVSITVASIRDEGFQHAKESERVNVVQWGDEIYESYLIERTINSCKGPVDVVIDFGSSRRSLDRSLQCLAENGVVLINSENGEQLKDEFDKRAQEKNQKIELVAFGSIEDLCRLVELVANNEIEPPPLQEFPVKQACEAVCKLGASEIQGRAVLRFHPNQ